jgi:hypothetical protein
VAYVASHAAYERASWRPTAAAAWTVYAALVMLLPWLQRRLPARALRTALPLEPDLVLLWLVPSRLARIAAERS